MFEKFKRNLAKKYLMQSMDRSVDLTWRCRGQEEPTFYSIAKMVMETEMRKYLSEGEGLQIVKDFAIREMRDNSKDLVSSLVSEHTKIRLDEIAGSQIEDEFILNVISKINERQLIARK